MDKRSLKIPSTRVLVTFRPQVVQTFYISLTPVDDAIPMVINNGLRAQEGVRKLITEFDLKAVDPDTKVIVNNNGSYFCNAVCH